MAEKKKGAPELTEAQREKARAQMLKQKEKAAKKAAKNESAIFSSDRFFNV